MSEPGSSGSNPDDHQGSTDEIVTIERRRVRAHARRQGIVLGAGVAVLILLVAGWSWSIAHANDSAGRGAEGPGPTATIAAALDGDAPSTAYLTDAVLSAIAAPARGASGRLRAQTALPGETIATDSLPSNARVVYTVPGDVADKPSAPGIREVAVAVGKALKPFGDMRLITLVPFDAKKKGRVGLYFLGSWPAEHGAKGPPRAPADRYAAPNGFIEVTRENKDTPVSEHFRLGDFLTHDQPNVWPKYLVLQLRNVDKLELVLKDLESRGFSTAGVVVMSGFRTPQYNEGGGNTGGRAGNSRHMYGDAADIYIDNDHSGSMDDLNRDGRVDIGDARVILESVDRVERAHPELIGGAGVYVACCGHGPFIHIDTRGYRARWTGSGGG